MISETVNNILMGVVILIVLFLISVVPYAMGRNAGYRDGQIDALNGKLHYRLEKQADSEFRWIECPNICDYKPKGE